MRCTDLKAACSAVSDYCILAAPFDCHAAGAAGASFSPCQNFFVPQINSGNGVNADCEKPEGGVSFACLAGKLG
jgi:hypothetical protein